MVKTSTRGVAKLATPQTASPPTPPQRPANRNDARLWEIAENLHRADLTVTERSEHIAEWVRLTEDKQKMAGASCAIQPDAIGRKRSAQQQPSGINAAVRDLGIDRTEAQRAVKIASLTPEAKEA
jgi:hypothetical protein